MSIEAAYRYIVVKSKRAEPLRYYFSRSDKWVDAIRDAEFFYCADTATFYAETFNRMHKKDRGVTYSALAIRADAMPYKNWMQ